MIDYLGRREAGTSNSEQRTSNFEGKFIGWHGSCFLAVGVRGWL